jgi:NADH-quinone oxidoreductase subunit C
MSESNGTNPDRDVAATNLPGHSGEHGEGVGVRRGMFGARAGQDTSG